MEAERINRINELLSDLIDRAVNYKCGVHARRVTQTAVCGM